jgi:hypothetical protein
MGVNYLWTRNFVSKKTKKIKRRSDNVWFANLSIGMSFRFWRLFIITDDERKNC